MTTIQQQIAQNRQNSPDGYFKALPVRLIFVIRHAV